MYGLYDASTVNGTAGMFGMWNKHIISFSAALFHLKVQKLAAEGPVAALEVHYTRERLLLSYEGGKETACVRVWKPSFS